MRYRDVYPKWRIQENPSPAHAKKRGKLFRREPLLRCVAARTNFRRKRR